jgi:hypothetical protein
VGITSIVGVSEDALNLKNLMDGILNRVVSIFQSYDIPLPTRQYWTVGLQAIDCEQLVVTLVQVYLGPPGDQASTPRKCNQPRTAVVTVSISREIPTVGQNGRPPSAQKISEAAEIATVDAWALMQSVDLLDQWEEDGFGPGVIATVDIPQPEGGFQTVNMQLTMAVP